MAEFGQRKKTIIPIKKSDLKQAILKKNKALEDKNKVLESSNKDQRERLKSLEKEYVEESKKLNQLLVDVEFQEDRFQKLKGGVYSNEKLLADKLKKVGNAEKELCEYESTVEELEDKEIKLKTDIEALEFYKAKCSESSNKFSN